MYGTTGFFFLEKLAWDLLEINLMEDSGFTREITGTLTLNKEHE